MMSNSIARSSLEHDLILLGSVGIIDPPRAEVADAIARCHKAGIDVKMMGDSKPRQAIASDLGCDDGASISGRELRDMEDEDLPGTVLKVPAFTPV